MAWARDWNVRVGSREGHAPGRQTIYVRRRALRPVRTDVICTESVDYDQQNIAGSINRFATTTTATRSEDAHNDAGDDPWRSGSNNEPGTRCIHGLHFTGIRSVALSAARLRCHWTKPMTSRCSENISIVSPGPHPGRLSWAVPPEKDREMSRRAQAMLGYSIHPPFMGQLSASHPKKALEPGYVPPVMR